MLSYAEFDGIQIMSKTSERPQWFNHNPNEAAMVPNGATNDGKKDTPVRRSPLEAKTAEQKNIVPLSSLELNEHNNIQTTTSSSSSSSSSSVV